MLRDAATRICRYWNPLPASLLLFISAGSYATALAAETADYTPAELGHKIVAIDSSDTESFLGVRLDTEGSIFVGGREALFAVEPDDAGGYGPRRELYRFPDHTWVYDIAIRGDDLYVSTVSAIYLLPGARVRREGIEAKRLVWGIPLGHVHQCIHALAWGPEGDLYFSTGDPLWYHGDFSRPDHWGHWTFFSQPEGTRTPYNGVGGVFRIRPDGSRLRVVATGLRNACGLCFDRDWNLFTNDNDHESMPAAYVPGRLLHVTPHAYFAWPRGWMPSKTPDRKDLLETMFTKMGRGVPVGQTYYDDPLLRDIRNNLLVARWGARAVTRYPLSTRGASFAADEHLLVVGQDLARPVSVAVGRGGRVFVTIAYMAHNEGSPTYKSDLVMVTRANDPAEHPFEPYNAVEAMPEQLFTELSSDAWSRRYAAHVELRRRGDVLADELKARLNDLDPDDRAAVHLAHLAASQCGKSVRPMLVKLTSEGDLRLRLAAIRALVDSAPAGTIKSVCTAALDDPDPQVQHAALTGLFAADELDIRQILPLATSDDSYLRQAATILAAEKATLDELSAWCKSGDQRTRLAGVLAVGHRLTVPKTFAHVPSELPLDEPRGPVIEYADATIDLRDEGRIGNYTMAAWWKHVAHSADQEHQFALLLDRLDDESETVRLQAAQFLSLLNDSRSEPRVVQVRRESEDRRLALSRPEGIGQVLLAGPFPDGEAGFDAVHAPEKNPVDPAAKFAVGERSIGWSKMHTNELKDLRPLISCDARCSFYAGCRLESPRRQRIELLVGSDDGVKVWHNGVVVWTNDAARGALPFQDRIPLTLEAGGNDLLVRVRNRGGSGGLYLHYKALGQVAPVLPEAESDATLAERLAAAASGGQVHVPKEFIEVDWSAAAKQGDAANGKKLFQSIGCAKCHAVDPQSEVIGGPSLADAARRFTIPYVVESVLLPGKKISPVFRATQIVTSEGKQYVGLAIGETAEAVELLLPDAKRIKVKRIDVESRELQDISPMPHGLVKTPDELRDLLAYMLGR